MSQQEFWNQKFSRDGYLYGRKPNSFLVSCSSNFKKSQRFLCLGEGEGRNAVYFASKGYEVVALDASDIGLKKLEALAEEEEVYVKTRCVDLNEWEPSKKYGSIVTSYLHMYKNEREALFNKIESCLKEGGFFVGEFFSTNQLNYQSGGPKDIDLLYTVDDFLNAFPNCTKHKVEELETNLEEGNGHQGKAYVIRVIIQKN
ncbi:MAG: tellurium resistance protein [Arcobacter sp.]|nr:MAG: tellurium resistance protein [Arcobacter sp.]